MAPLQSGMTIGALTVLQRAKNTGGGNVRFMCRCSCGKVCSYRASELRNGRRTECHVCERVERRADVRNATRHSSQEKP